MMMVLAILLKSLSFVMSIAFDFKHVATWYRSAYSSSGINGLYRSIRLRSDSIKTALFIINL